MKKRILSFLLFAALLIAVGSARAASISYCTTAMQTTSGVCLSNGSVPPPSTTGNGMVVIPFSFNIANTTGAVGFANTDVLSLFPVPGVANQCDLLDIGWDSPALDTGGGLTATLGDTLSANRYITTASTLTQASFDDSIKQANAFVAQSLPFGYAAGVASTIKMTFTHANTTPATSGVLKGYAVFFCGPNPATGG